MEENKMRSKADQARDIGLENLKTCAFMFKCSPNYEEAIPYFKSAANGYKALKEWKEEIFCRHQLVECFRKTDSLWEEGNEYERISYIQIFDYKDTVNGHKNLINAHKAYYDHGDYQDASNCIYKIVLSLREDKSNMDSCEKLLKVSFDSMLKYSSVILKRDDRSDYIYKTFKFYIGVLVQNSKTRSAIESCSLMINSISKSEKDKSKLFDVYLTKIVCLIINESLNDELSKIYCECESFIEGREDSKRLYTVKELKESIDLINEKKFNENIYLIGVSLDNQLVIGLRNSLRGKLGKTSLGLQNSESYL